MAVAIVALIVACGGTAVAASKLVKGDKLIKKHSLSGNRLKNHTVTGSQVNVSSLPKVPSAASADSAGFATNAGSLGGVPATAFAGKTAWAIVQSDGTIAAQSGGISVAFHTAASGSYYLAFGESLVGKPVVATVNYGNFAGATPHDGLISTAPCGSTSTSDLVQTNCVPSGTNDANHLFVKTETSGASSADRSFYVALIR
jgi:hypothetical protein